MDHLPNDPHMLVSTINMLLRDGEYDSLDDLCNAFDRDRDAICQRLHDAGYVYAVDQQQLRPIDFDQ